MMFNDTPPPVVPLPTRAFESFVLSAAMGLGMAMSQWAWRRIVGEDPDPAEKEKEEKT